MVAHAVYVESKRLLAGTAERPFRSIAAIAGHVAGRTGAKAAAWSSGRPAAVVVAEAAANRVFVAITRHGTVAIVYRKIVIIVVVVVH